MSFNVKGSIVALVTPMNEDGSVNYEAFDELIEFHVSKKTDAILVLGTTGESPTLSHEEDEEVASYVIKKVNKRVPVLVGSGSNNTAVAVKQSMKFEKMGADALLVITPYYNRANPLGMEAHFKAVADSVNIPIILYNVPGRTGCSITIDVLKKLKGYKSISGIKEASGNASYLAQVACLVDDTFSLYSGCDDMIITTLALGGSGVISVLANIIPYEVHDMVHSYLEGNQRHALDLQLRYLQLENMLFIETNPIPIKEAMNIMGLKAGGYRLPLCHMTEPNLEKLKKAMEVLE